jgi:hypothetical protein
MQKHGLTSTPELHDVRLTWPNDADTTQRAARKRLSDILQLDELASVARRHLGGSPSEGEIMHATTEVIHELVGSGYAVMGDVVRDERLLCVRSWGLSPAETIKRIEDEWRALGRMPNLGEVCWLALTDAGRAEAQALLP